MAPDAADPTNPALKTDRHRHLSAAPARTRDNSLKRTALSRLAPRQELEGSPPSRRSTRASTERRPGRKRHRRETTSGRYNDRRVAVSIQLVVCDRDHEVKRQLEPRGCQQRTERGVREEARPGLSAPKTVGPSRTSLRADGRPSDGRGRACVRPGANGDATPSSKLGAHVSVDEARKLAELAASRDLHLISGPVVHLSPTFRMLWARIEDGDIGRVHTARGIFGGSGFTWAPWLHQIDSGGIFGQVGAYHVKSLTSLLGPVAEVAASVETTVLKPRAIGGVTIADPVPDLSVVTLRHEAGAISSLVTGSVIQSYRRPAAIELYGTEGTANLLGEDWDPAGYELWRNAAGCWEVFEATDRTWSWCDGLRDLVDSLFDGRAPLARLEQDLHILEIAQAARIGAQEHRPVEVQSGFTPLDLASPS